MAVAIVAGALANKPNSGGEAWVRLSWVLGLRRLGFDVFFVERLPAGEAVGRRYFEEGVRGVGLEGRAALLGWGGETLFGREEQELVEIAGAARVLFNISGHLEAGPVLAAPRSRVYVDLDPGFTQLWHSDPALSFDVSGHDSYVTVGLNVG